MSKYILRRILYMVPILFGITLITFLLFNVAGGNPAAQAAGKHASVEQIAALEKELGLDGPLYKQYFFYIKQISTLDFGRSWSSHQPIINMIKNGIGASLSLTLPAFFLITLLSVSMALLIASKRGTRFDKVMMVSCLAAMSLSSLVYILFLQYGLAYKLSLFPIQGWDTSWIGRWPYLILPIIIFVAISLGSNILFYRTVFLDEMYQDYVRTARAKGLSNNTVLFKHILRNALIPIITIVVMQMPFLILGSLLMESFFSIPGLGSIIYLAIQNSDFPVIKAMTFIGSVLYMIFQLVSDVLYAFVDPRVQLR